MRMVEARVFAGHRGEAAREFAAGARDGEWLAVENMPCWPEGYVSDWSPYDDGRMHGWFDRGGAADRGFGRRGESAVELFR